MLKAILIVSLMILSCEAHPHEPVGICPDYRGLIQHGIFYSNQDHLTVSLSGILNLTSGVDTLCYNHTLEKTFRNRPGIALCTY